MSHQHDRQQRVGTKHPGSKPGKPYTPIGQRIRKKSSPGLTGRVTGSRSNGAFEVTFDEGTSLAGRSFWYESYLAHTFLIMPEGDD